MRTERSRAMVSGRRWSVAALGLLLALSGPPAIAAGERALLLCVDDAAAEAKPAAALERWLKGLRLVLVQGACVQPAGARQLVARFERRGKAVELALRAPSGQTLRRRVPWLSRTDGALSRLGARGRLSELSVLLMALVTESRGAPRFRSAGPAAGSAASAPAARPVDEPPTEEPPTDKPSVEESTPAPSPPEANANQGPPPAADAGVPERRASFRPARRPKPRRAAKAPPAPAVRAAASTPRAPRRSWLGELRHLAIGVHGAARFRASDVWAGEIGGALRWRSVFARVGYQPPSTWDLEGRPLEVSAVPLALGWQPRLWRGRRLQLAGTAAFVAEQTALRRTDLPAARTHRFWDLGGALGAAALLRLPGHLELAFGVELTVLPGARTVEVPVPDGPAAALSRFSVQSSLTLWWGGRDG